MMRSPIQDVEDNDPRLVLPDNERSRSATLGNLVHEDKGYVGLGASCIHGAAPRRNLARLKDVNKEALVPLLVHPARHLERADYQVADALFLIWRRL